MLAIRCLDEGIDIPQITHAIIVASSQNPRQFIQRRGRVLRSFPNKYKATIYDCFVIPTREVNMKQYNGLLKSELKRGLEFSQTAFNKRGADSTIRKILLNLNVNPNSLIEQLEENEDE